MEIIFADAMKCTFYFECSIELKVVLILTCIIQVPLIRYHIYCVILKRPSKVFKRSEFKRKRILVLLQRGKKDDKNSPEIWH